MLDKRAQGRPARGAAAVGPQKIIEGMRDALRALHTSNVTRKDIARFAGVTPALVTYYFPERNTLIEAATVPVIGGLCSIIKERLGEEGDPSSKLLDIITETLKCYATDIAIVELYLSYRRSIDGDPTQDKVEEISRDITAFFDAWLADGPRPNYDGRFLTSALLGICQSVAYHYHKDKTLSGDPKGRELKVLSHAELIRRILMGGLFGATLTKFCETVQ